MAERVDVVVIGMGPGGEEVAERLADAGLAVVGVEKNLVGGECPYWGCIPSKMMIRAADVLAEGGRVATLAGTATVAPDWAPVARRIRVQATDGWDDRVAAQRFEGKGGTLVRGEALLTGPATVAAGGREFEAGRAVVIATGSSAAIPPIPGLTEVPYWTNREAIEAEARPDSLIIVGGGAIGVELAQVFTRFGTRVTVVEGSPRLIPFEEPEASEVAATALTRDGVELRLAARAASVRAEGGLVTLALEGGDEVTAERILVATGRRPNVDGLGLESAGIAFDRRGIAVDEHMVAAPGVWAIGDVTGKGAFTHMAVHHARITIAGILGRPHAGAQYHAVPRVTFTDPEIGAVGLTEQAARDAGVSVRTGLALVAHSTRGWIHGPGNEGFIKLVEDAGRGVLVGATSAGPWGGEVLSLLVLAVHAAVPTGRLREMIYAYPTFHRGIEGALAALATEA